MQGSVTVVVLPSITVVFVVAVVTVMYDTVADGFALSAWLDHSNCATTIKFGSDRVSSSNRSGWLSDSSGLAISGNSFGSSGQRVVSTHLVHTVTV